MRTELPQLLGKPADAEISVADTQQVVAHTRGFGSWVELAKSVMRTGGRAKSWNLPLYRIDEKHAPSRCAIRSTTRTGTRSSR